MCQTPNFTSTPPMYSELSKSGSAIFELTGRPVRASLNALYRATDVLFSYKDTLEQHLSGRERDLFSLSERLCFFDLTNTYCEGKAAGNAPSLPQG
jgi:hypothetical protein